MKKYILLLILSLSAIAAFPQQGKITTGIDKRKNKIGAQFNLTLKTTVDTTAKVVFPKGETFGPMMVIRDPKPDTLKKGARYELIKKYGLTQFDSGVYIIPKLKVLINKKPYFSDTLRVEVANVKVDTLQQNLYDIKPTIQVETPSKSWWWWYLIIAGIILVTGGLIYFIIKLFLNKKVKEEVYKTPIEKATSLLKTLENKQLWQKGEVKSYYSELTDIARNYIEEEIHIPAMESTTTELIEGLRKVAGQKKMPLSQETFENLEKVLKQADLVKFAKSKPVDFEILEDKKRVESSIVLIHKAVPEEIIVEENVLDELMKEKLLKKKKRQRIIITITSVFGVIAIGLGILIGVKGLDYVVDNTLGHPTKTLLEGEWVTSAYGNPAVEVQTPEVLKRINAKDFLPKNAMQLIKDMQTFQYGDIFGNFGIMVATNTYKENPNGQSEIKLDDAIEGEIKLFEKKGAQRITVFKEDYTDKDGSTGMRAYGTYIRVNAEDRTSIKMAYEMIYFHQGNGLQKVIVVHEEDDKYAKPLTDKLMKSVELLTETP